MPVSVPNLKSQIFDQLDSWGYEPVGLDNTGNENDDSKEADLFRFTLKDKNGEETTKAWVTVENNERGKIITKLWIDNTFLKSPEFEIFHQRLKPWAQRHTSGMQITNKGKLINDMKKRTVMKKKGEITEGYYPMGKKASYSDNVPQVKIILQHTRQIEEGEQRFRNIAKIFVENLSGERFLLPTNRPGLARVFARHIAEGGTPYDDKGKHITTLVEEYTQMAGFVRATKNGQFNESAQRLVNEGVNHYTNLRETLTRLATHRGYTKYFENYTPVLNEESDDSSTLNELFVQETLDPRIESVLPILNRLSKNLHEMSEVKELDEWAKQLVEGGDGGEADQETDGDTAGDAGEGGAEDVSEDIELNEAPGAETLGHNQRTAASNLKAFDLAEGPGDEPVIPDMDSDEKRFDDAEPYEDMSDAELMNICRQMGIEKMCVRDGEGGLANRDEVINALYMQDHDESLEEDLDANQKRVGQLGPTEKVKNNNIGKLVGANESVELSEMDKSQPSSDRGGESSGNPYAKGGKGTPIKADKAKKDFAKILQKNIDKSNKAKQDTDKKVAQHMKEGQDDLDAILRIIRK